MREASLMNKVLEDEVLAKCQDIIDDVRVAVRDRVHVAAQPVEIELDLVQDVCFLFRGAGSRKLLCSAHCGADLNSRESEKAMFRTRAD